MTQIHNTFIPVMVRRNYTQKITLRHLKRQTAVHMRTTKKCFTLMKNNYDSENSPLPSQPRPTLNLQSPPRGHRENSPSAGINLNSLPKFNLPKQGQKRQYTDHKTVENKIAKTENSIRLLAEHLKNRTCAKSL